MNRLIVRMKQLFYSILRFKTIPFITILIIFFVRDLFCIEILSLEADKLFIEKIGRNQLEPFLNMRLQKFGIDL